ncbi:hypothetical protein PBC1_004 [Bacillus phage PBC1]|uniref:Uncharacterized protein n=1 Tax=Bacillus phage PBC1 TaxID=1161901 RepID=I1TLD8_9CAUD|nr:hypothetical protein PBC1_gp04 [Bacillus phage PBC1]AFE86240.1 hypothetical protein PBC1_004 [Bacillus phage PBC1]
MHEKWIVRANRMYVVEHKLADLYNKSDRLRLSSEKDYAQEFHTKGAALHVAIMIGGVVERV